MDETPAVEQARTELIALFSEWLDALPRHDTAILEDLLDDSWVYTDITGTVRGKREYLEYVRGIPSTTSGRLLELTPRLHGEIALVTGGYVIGGTLADGTQIDNPTRFTAVWRRSHGAWRALAHHATRIAEP